MIMREGRQNTEQRFCALAEVQVVFGLSTLSSPPRLVRKRPKSICSLGHWTRKGMRQHHFKLDSRKIAGVNRKIIMNFTC